MRHATGVFVQAGRVDLEGRAMTASRWKRMSGVVPAIAFALCVVAGCATTPPSDPDSICAIFDEKRGWYKAASRSEKRWGTPVHVQMAITYQESTFEHDARPERGKLLGVIPWKRPSDAYGYAQALDSTWQRYQDETGRSFADRDKFSDAIDFVGWYTDLSQRAAGISKWDPYNQYLAYHEGPTGWKQGSYRNKGWLVDTAQRVDTRAREWGVQLKRCGRR
jgi:hypothetical protein